MAWHGMAWHGMAPRQGADSTHSHEVLAPAEVLVGDLHVHDPLGLGPPRVHAWVKIGVEHERYRLAEVRHMLGERGRGKDGHARVPLGRGWRRASLLHHLAPCPLETGMACTPVARPSAHRAHATRACRGREHVPTLDMSSLSRLFRMLPPLPRYRMSSLVFVLKHTLDAVAEFDP